MKRAWWVKQVGVGLASVAMLVGMAWADPIGTANVPQILNAQTFHGSSEQSTFRTTDGNIDFAATYYDDNAACVGVNPVLVQLFVFNLEGLLVSQTDLSGVLGPAPGSHYTGLNVGVDVGAFGGTGSFKFTWLVRDCTNTRSLVLPEFVTFRIVSP